MKNRWVVFDLDDTLINEIDYLHSAYMAIATKIAPENTHLFQDMIEHYSKGNDVFEMLVDRYPNTLKSELLNEYREHIPSIQLKQGAREVLELVKSRGYNLGIITDGRSLTQRNKINATGLDQWIDKIIISEEIGTMKPNEANYKAFMEDNRGTYFYIGDNLKKDFVTANELGWTTICLIDQGKNVHKQLFSVDTKYLPHHKINNLIELINFI